MALGKKPQINTGKFELINYAGEKTGVFFTIRSANNPQSERARKDAALEAMFEVNVKDVANATSEENLAFMKVQMRNVASVLAHCVTEWEWNGVALFEPEEGEEPAPFDKPCTPENVAELLNTPIEGIDILAQVQAKVAELGKPKPAPKKN